jgi:hypothetical protein
MNTHQKGYIAEQLVKLKAIASGWNAAKPEVEDRYDLILDDGTRLYRIQVKYVNSLCGEALAVDLRKECRGDGKRKVYTTSEIDAVIVYSPQTDKMYWLPPTVFDGKKSVNLRFEATKNGQQKGVRYLKDFEWAASINSDAALS